MTDHTPTPQEEGQKPARDELKKLRKQEQRALERLQEAQKARAKALERFQRAEARLQKHAARVQRVEGRLALLRQQLEHIAISMPGAQAISPAPSPADSALSSWVIVSEEQSAVVDIQVATEPEPVAPHEREDKPASREEAEQCRRMSRPSFLKRSPASRKKRNW
ncbi:MAG: hypothetical protein NVS3B14_19180 [Ktedonobacteraceae bacterium]